MARVLWEIPDQTPNPKPLIMKLLIIALPVVALSLAAAEGYEVREGVYGQVSVRRRRPRLFTDAEEHILASQLKRLRSEGRI